MNSRRASIWICAFVIAAAGAAVYASSLNCPFVFDDQYTIVESPHIKKLWPLSSAMSSPYQSSVAGRPIVAYSLALSYAINGLDARVFHVFNILVHIAAALLLFGIIRRTLVLPGMVGRWGSHATPIALVIALLWVLHPLQTESVTYIIQRSESISGLFYLATFYCFIRGTQSVRPIAWWILAVVACGLGMASKEIAITAPFLILVYDRIFVAGNWRELRRRWSVHASLASTWIVLYLLIRSGPRSDTAGFSMEGLSPWTYAATQFGVILHYLRLAFFPGTLCIDYGWQYVAEPLDWVPQMLVILALVAAAVYALWRAPRFGFLAAAFFVLLSPTSSFVPISDAAFEHRMYLPLAAIMAMAVISSFAFMQRLAARRSDLAAGVKMVGLVLLIVACGGLGARTVVRNRDYSSATRLWHSVLETNPTNPRAFVSLGNNLLSEKKLDQAKQMFQRAISIDPEYVASYYGLSKVLMDEGKYQEALGHAEKAVQIEKIYPEAKLLMGIILTKLDRLDEAAESFRQVLAMNPDHAEANFNLACIYDKKGHDKGAEAHYLAALRVVPQHLEASLQLADLYMRLNQPQEAIEWYMKHQQLAEPTLRELNRLATALAQINRLGEAVTFYEKALRLNPNQAAVRLNFGNTLMRLNRPDEAIAQYEEALRIDPKLEPARQALARARPAATSQP